MAHSVSRLLSHLLSFRCLLQIARDPTTGASKGYGFVSYHDFDAADMAVENMNGQFFGGKQISVQYAFKKDGKGERHGTTAERLLAAQAKCVELSQSFPHPFSIGVGG
jgi:RNA recognition motif-containing protein